MDKVKNARIKHKHSIAQNQLKVTNKGKGNNIELCLTVCCTPTYTSVT